MTEDEAVSWISARYDRAALERLRHLEALVRAEATEQNLIAPSTLSAMWSRHIVDSVQLDALAPKSERPWVDVGTGAGFPGLAIACVRPGSVILVEPRRRRADFLERAASELGLTNARVIASKVEAVPPMSAGVISARAVAGMETLFDLTSHIRSRETTYVLPRGSRSLQEVEALKRTSKAMFHVEHSVTDAASIIVVALGVATACTE